MARISVNIRMPKKIVDANDYLDALERAQRLIVSKDLVKLFEETVEGWEHKPDFVTKLNVSSGTISVTVRASGQYGSQYALVSKGSPSHTIVPSTQPYLRFQRGYRAATKVGVLRSGPKSRFGNYVSALGVNHPGFEPRDFPKLIKEEYSRQFTEEMQGAINNVK